MNCFERLVNLNIFLFCRSTTCSLYYSVVAHRIGEW